jgi:hypothetical protein
VDDPDHLTRAQSDRIARTRRSRNYAMLGVLALVCLIFYGLAFVKLSGH